jgi:hypothetical protein
VGRPFTVALNPVSRAQNKKRRENQNSFLPSSLSHVNVDSEVSVTVKTADVSFSCDRGRPPTLEEAGLDGSRAFGGEHFAEAESFDLVGIALFEAESG